METAEEAGQELFTTGEEERIPDAAACSREEGKEEEEVEVGFDELGLDEQLKRALRKKGIAKATPIQREAIPLILVRGYGLHAPYTVLLFCFVRILFRFSASAIQ
jgi:ATP-dependent RNA helicase DDX56/DBP9